jgi:hypothetical protein
MKEYPLFKNLLQFSNLYDLEGNVNESAMAIMLKLQKEERKRPELSQDDESSEDKGKVRNAYDLEGGSSEEQHPNANGNGQPNN